MATQEPYLPIQVGKAISNVNLGIQGDDTGNNISEKNGSYCELTAMYWAWKNMKGVDYIGLCHYRRYFNMKKGSRFCLPYKISMPESINDFDCSIPAHVKKNLQDDDCIILAKEKCFRYPLYIDYSIFHNSDDLRVLDSIIRSRGDKKYIDAFNKVMYRKNKLSPYNMFIMPWPIFEDYCKWLFDTLKGVEDSVNIESYSHYQKRIFGYMSERLLNVYVEANNLKSKKYPIIWFADTEQMTIKTILRHYFRNALNSISNKLVKGEYFLSSK